MSTKRVPPKLADQTPTPARLRERGGNAVERRLEHSSTDASCVTRVTPSHPLLPHTTSTLDRRSPLQAPEEEAKVRSMALGETQRLRMLERLPRKQPVTLGQLRAMSRPVEKWTTCAG